VSVSSLLLLILSICSLHLCSQRVCQCSSVLSNALFPLLGLGLLDNGGSASFPSANVTIIARR
jgi:hypothetical protein